MTINGKTPSAIDGCRAEGVLKRSRSDRLLQAVLLVELVHASAGVNQFLLAGIEGVALGADFNRDVLFGGASLNDIAAGAADSGRLVFGMNTLFHFNSPHYWLP